MAACGSLARRPCREVLANDAGEPFRRCGICYDRSVKRVIPLEFDEPVADALCAIAAEEGVSLSDFLLGAAIDVSDRDRQRKLRNASLLGLLDDLEEEHGPLSQEVLARVEELWPAVP